MRNRLLFIVSLLLISSFLWSQAAKPRIIVTADPELDDNNSLIRFLLYSDQFDIDGLIYASSQFHWKGDGKGTTFMVKGREYTRYGLNLVPVNRIDGGKMSVSFTMQWMHTKKFIKISENTIQTILDQGIYVLKSNMEILNLKGSFPKTQKDLNGLKLQSWIIAQGPCSLLRGEDKVPLPEHLNQLKNNSSIPLNGLVLRREFLKK